MTVGLIIDLKDAVTGEDLVISEGESLDITGTFKDGDNATILKTAIASFTVTLFDETGSSLINSRNDQSILI